MSLRRFQAGSSKDQVAGESVRALLAALTAFRSRAERILASHGIVDPQPGHWYSWQSYLDAQREIYERVGSATIKKVGKALVEGHEFPAEIRDLDSALTTLDGDYRARHRARQMGGYRFARTEARAAVLTVATPYPCELDVGLLEAYASRFRPNGALIRVLHKGDCAREQGEACRYQIMG
jgi:hypothetical protein